MIEWKSSYKIGDPTIDAQHQEWFLKVNRFLEATTKKDLKLFELQMHQYTRVHFAHEEKLMRSIGYPDIDDHIQRHKALTAKFAEVSEQIANDTLDINFWKSFLSDWLLSHIRHSDQKLAAYVEKYINC